MPEAKPTTKQLKDIEKIRALEPSVSKVSSLPIKLSEHQIVVRSREKNSYEAEIEQEKAEQKLAKKTSDEKILKLKADTMRLMNVIDRGEEHMDVPVTEFYDLKENRAYVVNNDTGKVAEVRTLSSHEKKELKQVELPMKGESSPQKEDEPPAGDNPKSEPSEDDLKDLDGTPDNNEIASTTGVAS